MGIRDWFGIKTYGTSSPNYKTNSTEKTHHKLEGSGDSHDRSWSRTTIDALGNARTEMGETGRNSVARDRESGRSADRSARNSDRDRESR